MKALKTDIDIAMQSAMIEWNMIKSGNNGNSLADEGDVEAVTYFVNGGHIGIIERNKYTKNALGETFN